MSSEMSASERKRVSANKMERAWRTRTARTRHNCFVAHARSVGAENALQQVVRQVVNQHYIVSTYHRFNDINREEEKVGSFLFNRISLHLLRLTCTVTGY